MTRSGAGHRRGGGQRKAPSAAGAPPVRSLLPRPVRPPVPLDLNHHDRALMIIGSGRRALLRATSEAELLDLICRIAVEEAGYRLAWVGFAQDDPERTVRPVAQAGDEGGYLRSIAVSWADTPLGHGPIGTAIRTGRPVVGRSFLIDAELAPWRDEAVRHGFAASLALPLLDSDKAFGALTIYATTPDAFTTEVVELLTSLADDLALGITTLRARAAAEESLRRSERNLAEAQRIAHLGSWTLDPRTGVATWSSEMYGILGLDPDGPALGLADISRVFSEDSVRRVMAAVERALATGEPWQIDLELELSGGRRGWVASHGIVERDAPESVAMIRGTMQDITERVAAEAERSRLVAAVEQTADAVWMKDADGSIVTYINRSFSRLYGYTPDEIVGHHAGILHSGRHETAFFDSIWASVGSGSTWTGSIVNRRKDGTFVEVEAVVSGIRDASGRLISYMQTDRDVTRERALENALEREAREREMIEASLTRIDPAATPEAIAVAACAEFTRLPEIDSAWAIGLGADHGRILAAVGRVGQVLSAGYLVADLPVRGLRERAATGPWSETWHARTGDGAYEQAITASGLHTALFAPLRGPHGVVGVIAVGVHEATNAERLLERLPALATFGAIVGALVSPGLEARHREDDARARIQAILDAGALTPFFQPIVELHSGGVVGYEALSRFAGGASPGIVFRTAVRAGLGIELETATISAALQAATVLPTRAYLSLNASPELIRSGELRRLLGGVGRSIVIEITEHVAIDDYAALRLELTALGPTVRVAVDDAGAGYASLRHILELAPDFVKLDIGLIRGIDADPARQALIAGMGYFAVKRKLRLVAEGIETRAELETLRLLAVGYGQGYLLGRPQDGRGPGPWPSRLSVPTS